MKIGINWHADWEVQNDPAVRADILDKMAGWGAKSVRIDYAWAQAEYAKGQFNWTELDEYVAEAHQRDMTVLFMFYWPAEWAIKSGQDWGKGSMPRDPVEFGNFIGKVGERFGSKLAGIEMWNEPDLDHFWYGSQRDYLDLLAGAYPVAKALAPNVTFLAAAPTYLGLEGWYQGAYADSRFRPGVSFDAVGIHPYMSPADLPPNAPAGHWSINGIPELQDLRADHGDTSPLWATEFGWSTHDNSSYPPPPKPWVLGVTEEQQAAYYLGALILLEQYGVDHAYPYTDWNMEGSDQNQRNYGFLRDDRSPKPVVSLLTAALAGRPPVPPNDDLQPQIDSINARLSAAADHLTAAADALRLDTDA